jgi:hypothetical protein
MKIRKLKILEKTVIGPEDDPLLVRYILFRVPAFGFYLHKLCRSDYDRALHDHPWPFVSIVLRGGYTEVHDQTTDGSIAEVWHGRGSVLVRAAEWRHRFVLKSAPVWTLVIVGRRQRRWGFFLPTGWCWWRKHNYDKAICEEEVLWTGGSD